MRLAGQDRSPSPCSIVFSNSKPNGSSTASSPQHEPELDFENVKQIILPLSKGMLSRAAFQFIIPFYVLFKRITLTHFIKSPGKPPLFIQENPDHLRLQRSCDSLNTSICNQGCSGVMYNPLSVKGWIRSSLFLKMLKRRLAHI